MIGKEVNLNIVEVKDIDTNAQLVAENICNQLERRISFRRAMKQCMQKAMKAGALGIKTSVSGRLGGADMARTEFYKEGTIPLQTLRADIDYGFRVYKIDESNMKDEFYMTPDKISQEQIRLFEDNIKEDRTPDDLITQVILNLGLKLDLPIEEKDMCGNKVYDVDDGELLACFDDNVSIDIIEEIAKINPRQVVFRDSSFATDQDKINFEERLKRLSAGTKFNVL